MANFSKELKAELEASMKGITDAYVRNMAYAMDKAYPDGASDEEYFDTVAEFNAMFSRQLAKSIDDLTSEKMDELLS